MYNNYIENELQDTLEKNQNVALIDRDKLAEEMKTGDGNNSYKKIDIINEREIVEKESMNKGDIHE